MYILIAILIFSILIVSHELGHFLAAKACGVQVNEFSVFMGPKLLQFKGKETTYSLRLIPIGGYCAMEGEDGGSENPRAFTAAAHWKRIIILVAGAAMNFLLGLITVFCIYSSAEVLPVPAVTDFFEGCPYESEDGLQEGDIIWSIDGKRVRLTEDVSLLLSENSTQVYDIVLIRDGEKIKLENYPMTKVAYETENGTEYKYGFYFGKYEDATFLKKLDYTWGTGVYFTRLVWSSLGQLVNGSVGLSDMSGPVGIVKTMSDVGESSDTTADGILNVLYLGAFIAVNLAVMNMLPIPALDGGRVFFLLVTWLAETVLRRKIDPKYEGYVHAAGMILLLILMAVILFQDVFKLIF